MRSTQSRNTWMSSGRSTMYCVHLMSPIRSCVMRMSLLTGKAAPTQWAQGPYPVYLTYLTEHVTIPTLWCLEVCSSGGVRGYPHSDECLTTLGFDAVNAAFLQGPVERLALPPLPRGQVFRLTPVQVGVECRISQNPVVGVTGLLKNPGQETR